MWTRVLSISFHYHLPFQSQCMDESGTWVRALYECEDCVGERIVWARGLYESETWMSERMV